MAEEVEEKADALGRQDYELPQGTRICVAGRGRGSYVSYEGKWVGANVHTIAFDAGGLAAIKLKEETWTVKEAEMDALLAAEPIKEPEPDVAALVAELTADDDAAGGDQEALLAAVAAGGEAHEAAAAALAERLGSSSVKVKIKALGLLVRLLSGESCAGFGSVARQHAAAVLEEHASFASEEAGEKMVGLIRKASAKCLAEMPPVAPEPEAEPEAEPEPQASEEGVPPADAAAQPAAEEQPEPEQEQKQEPEGSGALPPPPVPHSNPSDTGCSAVRVLLCCVACDLPVGEQPGVAAGIFRLLSSGSRPGAQTPHNHSPSRCAGAG